MTDQYSPCSHPVKTWKVEPPDFEEVRCSDCGFIIPGNTLTHASIRLNAAVDELKRVLVKAYIEPMLDRMSALLKRMR